MSSFLKVHLLSSICWEVQKANIIGYIVLYCNRFKIPFTQIIHKNEQAKKQENIFHLTVKYPEKFSSTVQQLAYRGWHRVNRQEELLTGGGRGGGRWWSWRVISNRRRRVSGNFIHTWCWWHRPWFLAGFNGIYSLGKMIQWRLGSSSFLSS